MLITIIFNKFGIIESIIGDYTKTLMIANRDFGNLNFAMIYYKTVSLLIFGFAYCLSLNDTLWKKILTSLIVLILILSATRANIFSLIFISIFYLYIKYFQKTFNKKIVFFLSLFFIILTFSNSFISTFFDKNEDSLNIKFGFITDYIFTLHNNPSIYLFGQGLGSGIITSERGLTYNLETTYLELFRIFGIFGFFLILILLIFPFIFYHFQKHKYFIIDKYYLLAYFCYVFIIIPSNPLFLSSTGMIVLVVTYSPIHRYSKMKIS